MRKNEINGPFMEWKSKNLPPASDTEKEKRKRSDVIFINKFT